MRRPAVPLVAVALLTLACSRVEEGTSATSTTTGDSTTDTSSASESDNSSDASGPTGDNTANATTADASTSSDSSGGSTSDDASTATTSSVVVVEVEGWGTVDTDCDVSDRSCLAQAACEAVTGEKCIFQDYDCREGDLGSFYPESGAGESELNFALEDLHEPDNYGNICACDKQVLLDLNVATDYSKCGYGLWFVVEA